VQATVGTDFDSGDCRVDQFDAVHHVAVADLFIECESVNLEREDGRGSGNFVDDIGAIGGIIDIGLEIIGESVFRVVFFHQILAEAELEKEIDAHLDQRFTNNRAILGQS
jgi:hypothetical protein